jgi:DNA-binding XRE family transcriptional regulator
VTSSNSYVRQLRVRLAGGQRRASARRLRAAAPGLQLAAGGDAADFVLMPVADFERLIDEADERGAQRAFERARGEEFVPAALADRLLKHENPVRVWREYRGLTLAELGSRTGLSKGYLSDIENGKRKGTLATFRAIARALQVDVEDLAAVSGNGG